MTSEQVLLTRRCVAWCCVIGVLGSLVGCWRKPTPDARLPHAPYEARQLWAVAPLRNEAGTLQADGVRFADQLAATLEEVGGIDVVPVNRVLQAMQTLEMPEVTTLEQAITLRKALGVDGLVAGTISAYDPYDPPSLGVAVDLYVDPRRPTMGINIRSLSWAATDELSKPSPARTRVNATQPVATVSGHFKASDPRVRDALKRYAHRRGTAEDDAYAWRVYRLSMDLYSEFVSYQLGSRLMHAEYRRLAALQHARHVRGSTPPDARPKHPPYTNHQLTQTP